MSEANKLPWSERVNMLSIHPDAATRDDVAKMAAELQQALGYLKDARPYLERWMNENNTSGRAHVNDCETHDCANLCDYIDAALKRSAQ